MGKPVAANIVEIYEPDWLLREYERLKNEELILCQEERNAT